MKSLAVASFAVVCLACFLLIGADAQEKAEPKVVSSAKAAREVVQHLEELIRMGGKRVTDEQLYTWSLRLAEAEHSAANSATARQAALATHADRMKALEDRTKASFEVGGASTVEVLAATYYRTSAEEWRNSGK